jgi:hypothetical protein
MRAREVIILDEAAHDLEKGRDFYDKREYGVGEYFVASLISDITSLRLYAGIHGRYFGFLRMLSKRFPFCIYYYMESSFAIVIAVLDMRMKPGTIRDILMGRHIPTNPLQRPSR